MQVRSRLPAGVDGWGYSLKGMMGMVVVGGFLITATYWALQRTVVPKVQARQPKKKKAKPQMGVGESFQFLAKSPYIRDLALLVCAHWMLSFCNGLTPGLDCLGLPRGCQPSFSKLFLKCKHLAYV